MRNMYRVVIFDAGGTLIGKDDPLGYAKEFAAILADLGVSAAPEEIHDLMLGLQREGGQRR